MALTFLASFSNSRVFPRPATSDANTDSGSVNPSEVVLAVPYDINMTYATIRNISQTGATLYYVYRNSGDPAPAHADVLANGMVLEAGDAYDLEAKKDVYVATSAAAPVPFRLDKGVG